MARGGSLATRLERSIPAWTLGVAGVITVLVVWDLAVRLGFVSRFAFAEPAAVLVAVGALLVDPAFQRHAVDTMGTWLIAMVLTSVVAIPLGLLMGYFTLLYRPASTVVHAARSVPSRSLIPVAVLLFGLETTMKVSIAFYAISWPLLLNSMYGVHSVEGQFITTGRSLGWGRRKLLTRVILPAAAPFIATGLRVAGSVTLIVVISAEILAARRGIGTELVVYQEAFRPDFMYAGMVIAGMIGVAIYYTFTAVERAVTPWAHAHRGSGR